MPGGLPLGGISIGHELRMFSLVVGDIGVQAREKYLRKARCRRVPLIFFKNIGRDSYVGNELRGDDRAGRADLRITLHQPLYGKTPVGSPAQVIINEEIHLIVGRVVARYYQRIQAPTPLQAATHHLLHLSDAGLRPYYMVPAVCKVGRAWAN